MPKGSLGPVPFGLLLAVFCAVASTKRNRPSTTHSSSPLLHGLTRIYAWFTASGVFGLQESDARSYMPTCVLLSLT
uniref:Putative secreted protein n=1 Tax=Anopheles darlingi TaxID=43151 RepID=A0A2M4DK33_ANODA